MKFPTYYWSNLHICVPKSPWSYCTISTNPPHIRPCKTFWHRRDRYRCDLCPWTVSPDKRNSHSSTNCKLRVRKTHHTKVSKSSINRFGQLVYRDRIFSRSTSKWKSRKCELNMNRLGQLRRLTIFFGASHRLENVKCARIMKNGVEWHQLKIV